MSPLPLTRDSAAQMIWNALQAIEVKYEYTLVSENGQLVSKVTVVDKENPAEKSSGDGFMSLLEDKYDATIVKDAVLTTVEEDDKGTFTATTTGDNGDTYKKVAKDYSDLLGQKVDVVLKNGDSSKVYGIYANEDSSVIASGFVGALELDGAKKVKLDGTSYKMDGDDNTAELVYTANSTTLQGLDDLTTALGTKGSMNKKCCRFHN